MSLVSPRMLPILLHPPKVGFCPDVASHVQGGCHSIKRKIHSQPHSKARGSERRLRARPLCFYQERKFPEAPWKMMRFRTCCSKIGHLGLPNILRWRSLRKWQKQEGPPGLPLTPPPKAGHNTLRQVPCLHQQKRNFLIFKKIRRGIQASKPCDVSLVYYAYLILPNLSYFCTKSGIQILRFNDCFGSSFPYEDSHIS